MKTIFLTIFEGVEAKNILRTPILEHLLKDADVRIVLFTKSEQKVEYYAKEFNDPRIVFEVVEWKSTSRIEKFFSKLKFVLLRTKTTNLKRKMVSEYEGERFRFVFGHLLNLLLAHSFVRKNARFLDFKLVEDNTYATYFDKYKPDLVFMAHLFDEPEIALLREAKKRGVKTVGFINSWDKVTSRCIMRLLPDKTIVFNSIVKDELVKYNEIPSQNIYVSGLPQYDYFFTYKPISREMFFQKIGAQPDRELLVYASMGRAFSSSDWNMIDFLDQLVKSDRLKKKCELLVRFQPNDFVDEEELKKRPHLRYDIPGIRFGYKRGVDWDMNKEHLEHLADTLRHMSVLVCYASSISIDAVVFNKPVININYEIIKNDYLLKSPTQYYKSEHYKNAINTGGIVLASSEEELVRSINSYLDNPDLQSAERARLVKEQCAFTDGRAGERIASFLLNEIE